MHHVLEERIGDLAGDGPTGAPSRGGAGLPAPRRGDGALAGAPRRVPGGERGPRKGRLRVMAGLCRWPPAADGVGRPGWRWWLRLTLRPDPPAPSRAPRRRWPLPGRRAPGWAPPPAPDSTGRETRPVGRRPPGSVPPG